MGRLSQSTIQIDLVYDERGNEASVSCDLMHALVKRSSEDEGQSKLSDIVHS